MQTKKMYEEYLNEEHYGWYQSDIEEKYGYCSNKTTRTYYWIRDRIGSLIRKHDPVLFEVGYNEWKDK